MKRDPLMTAAVEDFLSHLKLERGLSDNSLQAYRTDLWEFADHHRAAPTTVSSSVVTAFFGGLVRAGRKPATLARKLSAVKHFFAYLKDRAIVAENPAEAYRAPRLSRYHPEYLSVREITGIIEAAARSERNPKRNRAMVELLYGCGLRLSLIHI